MENYSFEIVSKKYGSFAVIAPARFRSQIEAHTWHVAKDPHRAEGRNFFVMTNLPRSTGTGPHQKVLQLHVLIWRLGGRPPAPQLDHRDGQPLNNSEDNLRAATSSQNACNRRPSRANSSGIIGVHWQRQCGKWAAQIRIQGKIRHLGLFADIEDARRARDAVAKEYRGEFAVLNEPRR